MQLHVLRQAAAPTVAHPLSYLRTQLTALTFPSPYLSDLEKLQANHRIHECEEELLLRAWLHTVPAELAKREAASYGLCADCAANTHPTLR